MNEYALHKKLNIDIVKLKNILQIFSNTEAITICFDEKLKIEDAGVYFQEIVSLSKQTLQTEFPNLRQILLYHCNDVKNNQNAVEQFKAQMQNTQWSMHLIEDNMRFN